MLGPGQDGLAAPRLSWVAGVFTSTLRVCFEAIVLFFITLKLVGGHLAFEQGGFALLDDCCDSWGSADGGMWPGCPCQ